MSDLQSTPAWWRLEATSTSRIATAFAELHALVPVALVVLWLGAVADVDPRKMTDVGLVTALPGRVFVLLALLVGSFAIALRRERLRPLVPFVHVVALVVMLYSVTAIVEDEPRFDVTYRHTGIIDYIASRHGVDPHLDAYFNWPGFFALGAFFNRALGFHSALSYAAWAPLAFNLLVIPPLLVIFRFATEDRRLVWLATWTFFSANWVAQDYLAPQAVAFVLWLVMLAILFTSFGREPVLAVGAELKAKGGSFFNRLWVDIKHARASQPLPVLPLFIALGIYGAMTTGHQLTPFPALLTVVVLTAVARLRRTALPVTMTLVLAGWISYMTIVYLAGHFDSVFGSISISKNLNQNVSSRVNGSSGHLLIVHARILFTVALWGTAAIGFARRLRRGKLDLALLVVGVVPFVLPIVQPYGGEMLLRVFLFALPAVAFFAAAIFYPNAAAGRTLTTTAILAGLAAVLLGGFQYARYGNENVDSFTRGDVEAVRALYRLAPRGATLAAVADNVPWKYTGYADYHYRSLASLPMWRRTLNPQPASVIAQFEYREYQPQTYVIATRSMSVYSKTYDGKDAAIGKTVDLLRRSGLATVLYDADGGTVLRLHKDPYPDDPMTPVGLRTFGVTALRGGVRRETVRFTGAVGNRIKAFVVVPPGAGQKPAVLFLHGTGGNRRELLGPAEQLARRGAVTLTITQPKGAGVREEVVDARRALDLLAHRSDVDPQRIGVVGYSNGGQTAAVLAGIDLRVRSVGLIATRGVPTAVKWIRHTQAHVFFQAGLADRVVPRPALERLIRAAPGRPRVRWYSAGHVPSAEMYAAQVAWQARVLGLRYARE
jgi:dienelactone hydrolase